MASIVKDPNGRKRILFVGPTESGTPVRLGKASIKQAEAVKVKLEQLVAAAMTRSPPDDETSRWMAGLDDAMHARVAKAGLVRESRVLNWSLAGKVPGLARAGTEARRSRRKLGQTKAKLLAFFGDTNPLRAITPTGRPTGDNG